MMHDVRWKQRFTNFDRAFVLLREVQERGITSLSQLEKEGASQRFELAFELAWKTMKDYLEEQGILVHPITPRNVIKEAFSAQLLKDAQVWIDMMLHRNLLAHTYNSKTFDELLQTIATRYFTAFDQLHEFFLTRVMDK
jgi:nucleotidyltransferase substrate binding protein (TIGR01987 family)